LVCRRAPAHHQEFVGDVLGPDLGIVMHDGDFKLLPGGKTIALVVSGRRVRQHVARVVPFLAAGAMWRRRQVLRDFVIGNEAPAGGALDPDAQHELFAALDRDRGHIAVAMHGWRKSRFVAELWLGQGAGRLPLAKYAPVEIDPGEVVVEHGRGGLA
jgi:hypothetical protein